jgi:hypothetical protein
MLFARRDVLIGAGALVLAGTLPAAGSSGTRRFALFRGDDRIGGKSVSVQRSGDEVEVDVAIDIAVRILGLPAYRYTLQSSETWVGGSLVRLEGQSNDNGRAHFARAVRNGDALDVEGSEFTGRVNGQPATTSYWTPAFLDRSVWISTQDGRPWRITATNAGSETVPGANGQGIAATRWRIRGELDGLDLFYDAAGEWIGSEFEARGETARFLVETRGAALTPLWVPA